MRPLAAAETARSHHRHRRRCCGVAVATALACLTLAAFATTPAAACSSSISKRPARPRAPPATPSHQAPPATTTTPRNNVTFPTYKCPHPYSQYYCLNEAKCFTVIIQDTPLYNCECKEGFVGQRCEYKDLDGSYLLSKGSVMLETASIATGALVALLLAGLVCLGAWVVLSRARNKRAPTAAHPPPVLVLRRCNA